MYTIHVIITLYVEHNVNVAWESRHEKLKHS